MAHTPAFGVWFQILAATYGDDMKWNRFKDVRPDPHKIVVIAPSDMTRLPCILAYGEEPLPPWADLWLSIPATSEINDNFVPRLFSEGETR